MLKVVTPLEVLGSYGFKDNGHGIWEYIID